MNIKKHFQYMKYLVRHKRFVLVAGIKLGVPLWRLVIHDWSKFLPDEWFAYVDHFYDPKKTNDRTMLAFQLFSICELAPNPFFVEDFFRLAWMRHQKRNKHHWEYWTRIVGKRSEYAQAVSMPMPETYVREMVADWAATGRTINGKWEVRSWFDANESKILIHMDSLGLVETLINQIDPRDESSRS